MRSKVVAGEMATAAGIPAVDRQRPRRPTRSRALLAGGVGRDALRGAGARATPRSSCGCSTPSRRAGTLVVDAGAARALREGGTSLLPVGIVEVRGGFDAGDAVDVADGERVIGKGIASYTAAELRRSWA